MQYPKAGPATPVKGSATRGSDKVSSSSVRRGSSSPSTVGNAAALAAHETDNNDTASTTGGGGSTRLKPRRNNAKAKTPSTSRAPSPSVAALKDASSSSSSSSSSAALPRHHHHAPSSFYAPISNATANSGSMGGGNSGGIGLGSGTAITGGGGNSSHSGNHNTSGSVSSANPPPNLRRISPSISLVPGPNGYFGGTHSSAGSKTHRQISANSKGPGSVASSAYGRKSPASLAGVDPIGRRHKEPVPSVKKSDANKVSEPKSSKLDSSSGLEHDDPTRAFFEHASQYEEEPNTLLEKTAAPSSAKTGAHSQAASHNNSSSGDRISPAPGAGHSSSSAAGNLPRRSPSPRLLSAAAGASSSSSSSAAPLPPLPPSRAAPPASSATPAAVKENGRVSPALAASAPEPVAANTSALPSSGIVPSGSVPSGLPPRSPDRHHHQYPAATHSGGRLGVAATSGLSSSAPSTAVAAIAGVAISSAGAAPVGAVVPSPAPLPSSEAPPPPPPTPPPPPARPKSGPSEFIAPSSDGTGASSTTKPVEASVTPEIQDEIGGASIYVDDNKSAQLQNESSAPTSTLNPTNKVTPSDGSLETKSKTSGSIPSDEVASSLKESLVPGTSPALGAHNSEAFSSPTNDKTSPLADLPPMEASVPTNNDTRGPKTIEQEADDDDEEEAELPGEEANHRRRGVPSTTATRSDAPVEFDAFLSTISSMAEIQRYKAAFEERIAELQRLEEASREAESSSMSVTSSTSSAPVNTAGQSKDNSSVDPSIEKSLTVGTSKDPLTLSAPPRPPPPFDPHSAASPDGFHDGEDGEDGEDDDDDASAPPRLAPANSAATATTATAANNNSNNKGSSSSSSSNARDQSNGGRHEGSGNGSRSGNMDRQPTLRPRALPATNFSASRVSAAVSISSCDGSLSPSDEDNQHPSSSSPPDVAYGQHYLQSDDGHNRSHSNIGHLGDIGVGGDYSDEDLESEIRSINGRSAQRQASVDSIQSSPSNSQALNHPYQSTEDEVPLQQALATANSSLSGKSNHSSNRSGNNSAGNSSNGKNSNGHGSCSSHGVGNSPDERLLPASGARAPNSKMFLSSVRRLAVLDNGSGSSGGGANGNSYGQQSRQWRHGNSALDLEAYPGIDLDESAEFDDDDLLAGEGLIRNSIDDVDNYRDAQISEGLRNRYHAPLYQDLAPPRHQVSEVASDTSSLTSTSTLASGHTPAQQPQSYSSSANRHSRQGPTSTSNHHHRANHHSARPSSTSPPIEQRRFFSPPAEGGGARSGNGGLGKKGKGGEGGSRAAAGSNARSHIGPGRPQPLRRSGNSTHNGSVVGKDGSSYRSSFSPHHQHLNHNNSSGGGDGRAGYHNNNSGSRGYHGSNNIGLSRSFDGEMPGGIDSIGGGGHRRGLASDADEFDALPPYDTGLGPQGRSSSSNGGGGGYYRPPHVSYARSRVSSLGDVSSNTSRNSSPLSARSYPLAHSVTLPSVLSSPSSSHPRSVGSAWSWCPSPRSPTNVVLTDKPPTVLVPRLRLEELRDSNVKIRSPTTRRHKTVASSASSFSSPSSQQQQQPPTANSSSSSGGNGRGGGSSGNQQASWSHSNGGFLLADLSEVTSLESTGGAPPDSSKSADVVLPSPRSAFSETVSRRSRLDTGSDFNGSINDGSVNDGSVNGGSDPCNNSSDLVDTSLE